MAMERDEHVNDIASGSAMAAPPIHPGPGPFCMRGSPSSTLRRTAPQKTKRIIYGRASAGRVSL